MFFQSLATRRKWAVIALAVLVGILGNIARRSRAADSTELIPQGSGSLEGFVIGGEDGTNSTSDCVPM